MSPLRVLGLSYLATASLFSLAIIFSDHAALRMVTREEADLLSRQLQARVLGPMLQFAVIEDEKVLDPQVSLPISPLGPDAARVLAHGMVPALPRRQVTPVVFAAPSISELGLAIIAPDLPNAPDQLAAEQGTADGYGGSIPPPLPKFSEPDEPK